MRTLLDNVFSFLARPFAGARPGGEPVAGSLSFTQNGTELLLRDPVPLYSPEHRLALFWAAKSGCTFGVKWFLHHTGQLDKALAHSRWVHDYREQVLTVSGSYRAGIGGIGEPGMWVVKLVRNPYARAVSSYLMAVRAGYEDEAMADFLGRPVDSDNGFSFQEFLGYLASIDLRNCNIHHRLQLHPAEESGLVAAGHIIQLEDSFQQLAACELQLGLSPAELGRFRKSGHNTARKVWPEFWGEVRLYRHLGTKILPQTANFYNERLRIKVATLYGADFHCFGYDLAEVPGARGLKLVEQPKEQLLASIRAQLPVSGPVQDRRQSRRLLARQLVPKAAGGAADRTRKERGGVVERLPARRSAL